MNNERRLSLVDYCADCIGVNNAKFTTTEEPTATRDSAQRYRDPCNGTGRYLSKTTSIGVYLRCLFARYTSAAVVVGADSMKNGSGEDVMLIP